MADFFDDLPNARTAPGPAVDVSAAAGGGAVRPASVPALDLSATAPKAPGAVEEPRMVAPDVSPVPSATTPPSILAPPAAPATAPAAAPAPPRPAVPPPAILPPAPVAAAARSDAAEDYDLSGLSEEKRQQVVTAFQSDPRLAVSLDPRTNTLRVDVRPPVAPIPGIPGVTPPIVQSKDWALQEGLLLDQVRNDPKYHDNPILLQEAERQIRDRAQTQRALEADAAGAAAAAERARKAYSDKLENQIMQNLYGPNRNITRLQITQMGPLGLERDAVDRLIAQIDKIEAGQGENELKRLGPGIWDAFNRIHLDPGNPQKITDPSELYRLAGPNEPDENKRLTFAGVQALLGEMYRPKTPAAHDESYMIQQHLEGARRTLTATHMGYKDPKGEDLFMTYLGGFFTRYWDARQDKDHPKTPEQLLNPESPDYVGKKLDLDTAHGGYKRSMPEIMKDVQEEMRLVAPGEAGTPAAAAVPGAPVVYPGQVTTPPPPRFNPTNFEQLKAAVGAGVISWDEGQRIGLERGWLKATPLPPPAPPPPALPARPQVPAR